MVKKIFKCRSCKWFANFTEEDRDDLPDGCYIWDPENYFYKCLKLNSHTLIAFNDPIYRLNKCDSHENRMNELFMNQEEILRKSPELWPQFEKTFSIDPNFTDTPHHCPVCHQNCYDTKLHKYQGIRVNEGRKFQWWHIGCFRDHGKCFQERGNPEQVTFPIIL